MKCVLLYSKRHFTPNIDSELNGSSAGVISREIYESLVQIPKVELFYFDAFNLDEWEDVKPDLLVSIVDSFGLAKHYFKPKYSIVIAVNQHPLDRLALTTEIVAEKIPIKALAASDGWLQSANSLRNSNGVVYVGNHVTGESLLKYMPGKKMYQTHYLPHLAITSKKKSTTESRSVLVLMSSIGFRKGFDRFYQSILRESAELSKYNFHILGFPENEYWADKVQELIKDFPNIVFHGWISNLDPKFSQILSSAEYAIFPTREEGMVGSLLECLENDIICLHTKNTGIDNSLASIELSSQGELNLSTKLNFLDTLSITEKSKIRVTQCNDWTSQVQNSEKIGSAVIHAVRDMVETEKISSRNLYLGLFRTFKAYLKVPTPILLRRIKFLALIRLNNYLTLRFPKLKRLIRLLAGPRF
jgi:hypothetical protein